MVQGRWQCLKGVAQITRWNKIRELNRQDKVEQTRQTWLFSLVGVWAQEGSESKRELRS